MSKGSDLEGNNMETTTVGGKMEPTGENADVANLSYEDARAELIETVQALENAGAPLEDTLRLWDRGEALAARCQGILDAAQAKLTERLAEAES